MRISLGGPEWAEVDDVSMLRDGHRKAVNKEIRFTVDEENRPVFTGGLDDDMTDALVRLVCRDWSLPFPPPDKDPKSLDKLTIEQGRLLHAAVAPHLELVKGQLDPTKRGTTPTTGSST